MVDCANIESAPDRERELETPSKVEYLALELYSGAGCSKAIEESHASSSQSSLRKAFVDMGFLPTLVDKVLEENGEENAELLLETLCAYSATKESTPESSDSLDEIFGDVKDERASADFAVKGPTLKDAENLSCDSEDSLDEIFGDKKDEGPSSRLGTDVPELEELDAAFSEDKRAYLLLMNFSEQEVDSALKKHGEVALDDLVEFILAAQAEKTDVENGKIQEKATESLFSTMDATLRLLEMGFTEEEVSSAIEKYGAEIPVEEIADSIFANRMANTCFDDDEDPPIHHRRQNHSRSGNYKTSPNKESSKRRSFDTLIAETEASSWEAFPSNSNTDDFYTTKNKGKRPKHDYAADYSSDNFLDTSTHEPPKSPFVMPSSQRNVLPSSSSGGGGIREKIGNRPYFFYGNVLDISQDTWKKLSQFLYAFDPEFANTQFFSALSRKEGYIHNLPRDARCHVHPRSPMSIEEAIPNTKKWWPSWDTRKQLSCINNSAGSSQICERLERMLVQSRGVLSVEEQTDILHHCKKMNLVWVGEYKLSHMEPQHLETILGYPVHHTLPAGSDPAERLALLKHSFQTDTLAYHLSSLKSIFRDGITLLSIYSGIGGAEIAIHRLGVQLRGVVSVESSEVNRKILKRWWENSGQEGKLVQFEGINKLTGSMVRSLVRDLGGFDLVVCQSRLIDPDNPTGFDLAHYYEFTRVLQAVRNCMECS